MEDTLVYASIRRFDEAIRKKGTHHTFVNEARGTSVLHE